MAGSKKVNKVEKAVAADGGVALAKHCSARATTTDGNF
jgi:hypothetical protein